MDANKIRLTLEFTQEQLETVQHLFGHYNWDFVEINGSDRNGGSSTCTSSDASTQTLNTETTDPSQQEGDRPPPDFHIAQDLSEQECGYCFCSPCITSETNRQFWWENEEAGPSDRNHGLRKKNYKRFWTMMFHRDVWNDPRYSRKKLSALQSDPRFRRYVWHRRDIMPKCVVNTVRQWLPNPVGMPYLGHFWE